jgi:hypothetical protein
MNLTEDEKVMVYRLRKRQQAWLWGRWVMLAIGIVAAYYGIRLLRDALITQQLNESDRLNMNFASLIFFSFAILFIGYPIKYWRGNPVLNILLKLVDHCSQDNQPPKN